MYADKIAIAIKLAKEKGLKIPVIYNSNGYENVETLKQLEGLIDVYLPDLKYSDDELSAKYSKVSNYFAIAKEAIKEMARQVRNTKTRRKWNDKKGTNYKTFSFTKQFRKYKKSIKMDSRKFK